MSGRKRNRSNPSDDSDSDFEYRGGLKFDNRDITVAKKPNKVPEIIDLDAEEVDQVLHQNHIEDEVGLARSRPRRNNLRIDYKEFFADSDEELEESKKILGSSSYEMDNLTRFLEYDRQLESKITHILFKRHEINLNEFTTFFRKYGQRMKSLSFETMNLQLLKQISRLCPILETLTIRESQIEDKFHYEIQNDSESLSGRPIKFSTNLHQLNLGTNYFFKNDTHLTTLFSSLPNTLEGINYSFTTRNEVSRILEMIQTQINTFKNLTSLVIQYTKTNEDSEEEVLHQEHISQISNLGLENLKTLELICGIWEDVKEFDLRMLLMKFSTSLKYFTIAGNVHGVDTADKQIRLVVPPMNHLISFSMGSVYEFEAEIGDGNTYNSEDNSTTIGGNSQSVVSLLDKCLIEVDIEFEKEIFSLETLSLGNLVNVKKISPTFFPNLRTLRIGSNWTNSIHIPMEDENSLIYQTQFPVFKYVRELQLPDCLINEFFVMKIRKMFPVIRKVWMNLPTVKCLRYFFDVMAHSQLSELRLKTQYDFKGVLESALFARPYTRRHHHCGADGASTSAGTRVSQHGLSYDTLIKYKNTSNGNIFFNEFIKYHNIELPISNDDEIMTTTSHGIADLTTLKTLIIGHVPRTIRIPTINTLPHNHLQQVFHPTLKIGFRNYPLAKQFFRHDLQKLQNIEKFRHGHNFDVPKYRMPGTIEYSTSGNRSWNWEDKNTHNFDEDDEDDSYWQSDWTEMQNGHVNVKKSRKLKVKIRPALLANEQLRVKKEKNEKETIKQEKKYDPKKDGIKIELKEVKAESIKYEIKTEFKKVKD